MHQYSYSDNNFYNTDIEIKLNLKRKPAHKKIHTSCTKKKQSNWIKLVISLFIYYIIDCLRFLKKKKNAETILESMVIIYDNNSNNRTKRSFFKIFLNNDNKSICIFVWMFNFQNNLEKNKF